MTKSNFIQQLNKYEVLPPKMISL